MAILYINNQPVLDTDLPVAIFHVGDNGDAENGPDSFKDYVGAFDNLAAAYAFLTEGFEQEQENTEGEQHRLNAYGLPYGYIAEQITAATLHQLHTDEQNQHD